MDLPRVLTALCLFLLSICLIFSFCALFSLRHALNDATLWQAEAQATIDKWNSQLQEQNTNSPQPSDPIDTDIPVDILYDCFCIRDSGGKIAIYTDDGYLVRVLDIPVCMLPSADQEALQNGITLTSWKEVLALIEDFEG